MTATIDVANGQVLSVLREAFEGAAQWSYFTDPGPEGGLLGTLAKVSAEHASQPIAGTSIAAQAAHILFGLEQSAAWIRGERNLRDWNQSWQPSSVDEEGWTKLQEQLRNAYQELTQVIEQRGTAGLEEIGGAIGAVTHVAYHLGAIRQKIAFLRQHSA